MPPKMYAKISHPCHTVNLELDWDLWIDQWMYEHMWDIPDYLNTYIPVYLSKSKFKETHLTFLSII